MIYLLMINSFVLAMILIFFYVLNLKFNKFIEDFFPLNEYDDSLICYDEECEETAKQMLAKDRINELLYSIDSDELFSGVEVITDAEESRANAGR